MLLLELHIFLVAAFGRKFQAVQCPFSARAQVVGSFPGRAQVADCWKCVVCLVMIPLARMVLKVFWAFCLCSLCKLDYGFCAGGLVGMLRPSLYCICNLIGLNGTPLCFCLHVFAQDGGQTYIKEQTTFAANGWLVNFVGLQSHIVISHNIEVV